MLPKPSDWPTTFSHTLVVLTVVISASILTALGHVDAVTLGTVYGAALGYAGGLSIGKKTNGHSQ